MSVLPFLLALAAALFNAVALLPDAQAAALRNNDFILHTAALQAFSAALKSGQSPVDAWLAVIGQGFPLFHYYQHLGYLPPALLSLLAGGALPAGEALRWTQYLLLCLFPLSIYISARWLDLPPLSAGCAALLSSLISGNGLLGLDWSSYLFGGRGLYTQAWGMLLLPLALGAGVRALRGGGGLVWAALLLAASLLSHLVCGYIAAISLAAWALWLAIRPGTAGDVSQDADHRWRPLLRLAGIALLAGCLCAYFLIPYYQQRAYLNRSVWEDPSKYDAYGAAWALKALAGGELLDYGRFPSLTLLAAAGLLRCLFERRRPSCQFAAAFFAFWLALYFGRPTWGVLLDLLPFSSELHLHRLLAGVHLGAIYLAGLGLGWPADLPAFKAKSGAKDGQEFVKSIPGRFNDLSGRFFSAPPWRRLSLLAGLWLALLAPVYLERAGYLQRNQGWIEQQAAASAADEQDLRSLVDDLRRRPPGRVYAGLAGGWGKAFTTGDLPLYAFLQYAGFDMHGFLYHALSLPGDIQAIFDERRADHYRVFNVRYIVAPVAWSPPPFLTYGGQFGRFRLYLAPSGGYFELADTRASFTGNRSQFYPAASAWLSSALPAQAEYPALFFEAPANLAVTRLPLALAPKALQQALDPLPAGGEITSQSAANGRFTARVKVARPLTLALKTSYHPNWQAIVDGRPTQTFMTAPGFIGLRLEPGTHEVQVSYRGVAGRSGWLLFGLLAWGAAWALERRRAFRQPVNLALARLPSVRFFPQVKWADPAPGMAVTLALALLAGLPLLQPAVLQGHDSLEYLPRTQEFCASLQAGLPPRWAPDLSRGYGQPFFLYNPPLFYTLSCGLRFAGASFIVAQNLALLLLLFTAGLGMFLLARRLFGPASALAAAAAYLFAPYLLSVLYVRAALADFCAFAFLPIAAWSVHRAVDGIHRPAARNGTLSLLAGSLAVAALNLSSNPAALIAFPALLAHAAWVALAAPGLAWRARCQSLLRALQPLLFGLGLAAFFWLPALLDRRLVHTDRLLQGILAYTNHFVYPQQLISSPWGYGISLPGTADGMSYALGGLHLGGALLAALLAWRARRSQPALSRSLVVFLALFVAAALLTATLSRPLWDRLPLLQYLEFPWRFLTLTSFAGALLAGGAVHLAPCRWQRWLAIGVTAMALLGGLPHAHPSGYHRLQESDYAPQAIAKNGLSATTANEYEPVWVAQPPAAPAAGKLIFASGSGELLSRSHTPERRAYRLRVAAPALLKAELFYFPGWSLQVDGKPHPITPSPGDGLVSFMLPPGEHTLVLKFGYTPTQRLAAAISFFTLGALLACLAARSSFLHPLLGRAGLRRRLTRS